MPKNSVSTAEGFVVTPTNRSESKASRHALAMLPLGATRSMFTGSVTSRPRSSVKTNVSSAFAASAAPCANSTVTDIKSIVMIRVSFFIYSSFEITKRPNAFLLMAMYPPSVFSIAVFIVLFL